MFIPNNDSLTEQYFEKSRHKKKENSYLFLCNIILTDSSKIDEQSEKGTSIDLKLKWQELG